MASMQVERDIAAPPPRVWAIITDLEHTAEVVKAIRSVERLDGGSGFGVGTRWRETREMMGREATETMEVTAIEEGRSCTVEAESRGAYHTSLMAVEPAGSGSRLSMSFAAEATSMGARIMSAFGKLFEGSTRKALARDLDDIAAVAERSQD